MAIVWRSVVISHLPWIFCFLAIVVTHSRFRRRLRMHIILLIYYYIIYTVAMYI